MKYLIATDIHGSLYYGQKIIDAFNLLQADKIILLGDTLYHGPRNDLPKEYNPKELTNLLNQYKNRIISVKGNCDSDVDQMVLQFPIIAPLIIMEIKNRNIYFTHGDVFNSNHLPPMNKNDILVHGHTHVVRKEVHPDHIYLNPGSISLPKENCYHGYMLLDEDCFYYYDENHQIKDVYQID